MITDAETFFTDLLLDSLHAFFLGGACFALLIGLLLITRPSIALNINRIMSREYSLRRAMKPIEVAHYTLEPYFYRYHRAIGLTLIFFSTYILYTMLFNYPINTIARSLGGDTNLQARLWLLESLQAFLILTSSLIILLGYLVYTRPSQLKRVETIANRWLSSRQAQRILDINHHGPTRSVQHHPRLWGVLILLGALFILYTLKWP